MSNKIVIQIEPEPFAFDGSTGHICLLALFKPGQLMTLQQRWSNAVRNPIRFTPIEDVGGSLAFAYMDVTESDLTRLNAAYSTLWTAELKPYCRVKEWADKCIQQRLSGWIRLDNIPV